MDFNDTPPITDIFAPALAPMTSLLWLHVLISEKQAAEAVRAPVLHSRLFGGSNLERQKRGAACTVVQ